MHQRFPNQWVVASGVPDNEIIVGCENEEGKHMFRFDSSVMNATGTLGYQLLLLFSRSTGELIIREVLSDLTVRSQRAVVGELTLLGGSFQVGTFKPSLARGALEAFFISITLQHNGKLDKENVRFETVKWNRDMRQQLFLHRYRHTLRNVKRMKLWIVNPANNTTFNAEVIRGAFERGGALPSQSVKMSQYRGYRDWDAVPSSDSVTVLEYEDDDDDISEFKNSTYQTGPDAVDPSYGGHVGQAGAEGDVAEARIKELEIQLRMAKDAKDAAVAQSLSARMVIESQTAAIKRAKERILQLEQYNTEHIAHCQPDTSALATELAILRGITQGNRQRLETALLSVRVGRPTVQRVLRNPIFIRNFLEPLKKRKTDFEEDAMDEDSDKENDVGIAAKRMRSH